MYPKVGSPKKVTMKWLDKAFAPLRDYLHEHHPDSEKEIMSWMTYKGNFDDLYLYENRLTQGLIEFDRTGKVVHCDANVMDYEYELGYERIPVETDFIHPNVDQWISRKVSAKKADIFREELRLFLQHVWGPMANFDFRDLKVGYPLQGRGSSYCLYVYPSKFNKMIAFQFVGDEIVEKNCSLREYQKYERSEREFMYQGWHLATLIREHLAFEPDLTTTREVLKKGMEWADLRIDEDTEFVLTAEAIRMIEQLEKEESEKV
ncbi:hypothetical protein [Cohnella sp. GCM10027633]|uniref:hypothetical protein n=1 Tax=unclassified Cohnella TaxID=2636738 RepID=UPI00363E6A53